MPRIHEELTTKYFITWPKLQKGIKIDMRLNKEHVKSCMKEISLCVGWKCFE